MTENIFIGLVVIGALLWLILRSPLDETIKGAIKVLVLVLIVIFFIHHFWHYVGAVLS